jgi:hypothetical protein
MPSNIPPFTLSGVLPPFVGTDPMARAARAPYQTDILDLVQRFATTPERVLILQGYLEHRAALNGLGFERGFQWCDGSFVEDKVPQDLDIVTFFHRPTGATAQAQFEQLVQRNLGLFTPQLTKHTYHCDAYFVDLSMPPELIVARSHYWFGGFTHRRITLEWKGIVEVPLMPLADDAPATAYLAGLQQP